MNNASAMPKSKKIQIITAGALTLSLLIIPPTYSWFNKQQKMARYEKIKSPNTLYITAASREDSKSFQIAGVDVSSNAYWVDSSRENTERKTYQDYVFSVAGDYVYSFTLQLAHTTNNNYNYEIYEAEVMGSPPSGKILGKDYIEYKITDEFEPDILEEITANPIYTAKAASDNMLYYRIKKDSDGNPISLNSADVYSVNAADSEYDTDDDGEADISYNGHYLNWETYFTASDDYHDDTYSEEETSVQAHAEPLYWQATGITGGDATDGEAFYHEYILRISWDTEGANAASPKFKDTDIIYLTARAE